MLHRVAFSLGFLVVTASLMLMSLSASAANYDTIPVYIPWVTEGKIEGTATTTSTLIKAAASATVVRTYFLFQNKGAAGIYLQFDSVQASSTDGVFVSALGNYEPNIVPQGSVYVQSVSGSQAFILYTGKAR